MTIKVPYRGIIEIVGDHDTGKTIAALQTTNSTKDVVFVDDDVKGEGTVRQMKETGMEFDLYIDLSKERAKLGETPTASQLLENVVLPTVRKIIEKRRKIIVWDTWRIVYQSARGHVERNQNQYSHVVNFRGNSQIIQGLISKVARMIELKILNELKDHCDLLIITHHIKDNYVGGIAVGKIPESSNTFSEVCNMRMWLRRNSRSKVPLILFLKRPSLPKASTAGIRFVNIVPLKITPTEKHQSIWDAIAEYEARPIESRMPTEEETPTAEELAAISGTLTAEQKSYVQSMIEFNKQMEKDLLEADENIPPMAEVMKAAAPKDVPANILQLISMSREKLGLDMAQVQDILELSYPELLKRQDELPEFWKALTERKEIMIAASKPKKKK